MIQIRMHHWFDRTFSCPVQLLSFLPRHSSVRLTVYDLTLHDDRNIVRFKITKDK